MTNDRPSRLLAFAREALRANDLTIEVASADASFRSYWRARRADRSWILMDAPPTLEDVRPWLDIGARLRGAGLHAPEVFACDIEQGFVLMEDLGARTYLPELNADTADALYADALDALLAMQSRVSAETLPVFDATRTIPEMELLDDWFLRRHLRFVPNRGEQYLIAAAFRLIAAAADEQPRRFMHRDYHSRNLLIAGKNHAARNATALANPGIIDFQGAMLGPIAYDLASLLRDCYIVWPAGRVDTWMRGYHRRLVAAGLIEIDAAQFRRGFDLIGLQRHIKVLGLFCRLHYRDGKAAYLGDLPLVFDYVMSVASLYPELADFRRLLRRARAGRDLTQARGEPA